MRAVLLFFVAGCASLGGAGGGGDGQVDRPMPELVIAPLRGSAAIHLAKLRGKVVLLDLWASWCEPCREEMPLLDDLAVRLRSHGVEIIAVSLDEDRSAAETFLKRRRSWNLTLGHDPSVGDRLSPAAMPTSYVIDRRGILRQVNSGFSRGDMPALEARLRALAR